MPFYWILVLGAGFLILIFLVMGYIFSNTVLYSRRQPVVRTPQEYGMAYEDVQFSSTDGLLLKGWYIPVSGVSERAIILTHPLPFNRHGFLAKFQGFPPLCRIDVDLLKTAQALHQAGHPILMFDFRNHGESEAGLTGVGLNEYQDLLGAIEYLNQRTDLVHPRIGLVSFCMGANAPLAGIVDWFVQRRGGYALKTMSPLPYVKDVKVPVLYVQAYADRWTSIADTQSFYDATPDPKEMWWIEGITRRFDTYNYIGDHPERVLGFVKEHFDHADEA